MHICLEIVMVTSHHKRIVDMVSQIMYETYRQIAASPSSETQVPPFWHASVTTYTTHGSPVMGTVVTISRGMKSINMKKKGGMHDSYYTG